MGRIGIMQGRLLPPLGNRIQGFPARAWADEFDLAAAVTLDAIEWIYEVSGAADNPVGTPAGVERLRALAADRGVGVWSLCADYFMDRPLLRVSESDRREGKSVLRWLVGQCAAAGMERIVLPFVDVSRIASGEDARVAAECLRSVLHELERTGVEIHLETDLPPYEFAGLLAAIDHPLVRANYDSGNSASLGYDPRAEFAAYGEFVGSIHVKDRVRGGGTVPLGQGDVDFDALFAEVRRVGYCGDFVLQVARGSPGEEVEWARHNLEFLRRYLDPLGV